jgi:hypothetical protein
VVLESIVTVILLICYYLFVSIVSADDVAILVLFCLPILPQVDSLGHFS